MDAEVCVFADADALVAAACERLLAAGAAALATHGRFSVALAGGNTPRALYHMLARQGAALDWRRVHFFWGDERCVPPDAGESNFRMVRETLLEHLDVPEANVHRMYGELTPSLAAERYERELRVHFDTPVGEPQGGPGRRFDTVLLGLGADAHTASLFPGGHAVHERTRWVVADDRPELIPTRLTLTPPVINQAAQVMLLVTGAAKADAVYRVLRERPDPGVAPATAIHPAAGALVWLLDEAAAARL